MLFIMSVPPMVSDEFAAKLRRHFSRGRIERFGIRHESADSCIRIVIRRRGEKKLLEIFRRLCKKADIKYEIHEMERTEDLLHVETPAL